MNLITYVEYRLDIEKINTSKDENKILDTGKEIVIHKIHHSTLASKRLLSS